MGAYWLNDLPDVLAAAGLDVDVYDGWQTRSRSSGGYDGVWAIGIHHDASSTSTSEQASCDYGWLYADDRPIGAIRLGRDGHVTVGAAGATNTMGKGGPIETSHGTIPLDKGNQYMIAIEAGNNGVGEAWGGAMLDAYIVMVAALCDAYGLDSGDVHTHHSYVSYSCPGRKIDPAGPTPRYPTLGGSSGAATTWDADDFRDLVDAWHPTPGPDPEPGPEPEPEPEPTPPGGDFMVNLPTIKKGATGDYVERMQHLLAAAGYMNPANVANYDGVWGDGTDKAKAKFDNEHGLGPSPPTDCGAKSWESLMTGRRW